MTYSEKLKDPQWQKMRLKVMERDNWQCQSCGDKKLTLHIHHKIYLKGKEPWESQESDLVTLCEKCHKYEKECRASFEEELLRVLRTKYFANQVLMLSVLLEK